MESSFEDFPVRNPGRFQPVIATYSIPPSSVRKMITNLRNSHWFLLFHLRFFFGVLHQLSIKIFNAFEGISPFPLGA